MTQTSKTTKTTTSNLLKKRHLLDAFLQNLDQFPTGFQNKKTSLGKYVVTVWLNKTPFKLQDWPFEDLITSAEFEKIAEDRFFVNIVNKLQEFIEHKNLLGQFNESQDLMTIETSSGNWHFKREDYYQYLRRQPSTQQTYLRSLLEMTQKEITGRNQLNRLRGTYRVVFETLKTTIKKELLPAFKYAAQTPVLQEKLKADTIFQKNEPFVFFADILNQLFYQILANDALTSIPPEVDQTTPEYLQELTYYGKLLSQTDMMYAVPYLSLKVLTASSLPLPQQLSRIELARQLRFKGISSFELQGKAYEIHEFIAEPDDHELIQAAKTSLAFSRTF